MPDGQSAVSQRSAVTPGGRYALVVSICRPVPVGRQERTCTAGVLPVRSRCGCYTAGAQTTTLFQYPRST